MNEIEKCTCEPGEREIGKYGWCLHCCRALRERVLKNQTPDERAYDQYICTRDMVLDLHEAYFENKSSEVSQDEG